MIASLALVRRFSKSPVGVYWESTRACDLVCRHCRANAIANRESGELTTDQVKRLFDQIREFETSFLVITGGDPMKRGDLFELIEYATTIGLQVALTPSATNNITFSDIQNLKRLGVQNIALSLDGSDERKHDSFRQVCGCFSQTLKIASYISAFGIPLQINTTVTGDTIDDIPSIYGLISGMDIIRWSLFFLVPIGRGKLLKQITADQAEEVLNWLYEISKSSRMAIKTTEAHHFRRIVVQRELNVGRSFAEISESNIGKGFGIRDGSGVMFISSMGDIFPSGFLPVKAGNVRRDNIVDIYRNSKLFNDLRNADKLKGKCGACKYKSLCGGSRARAFAITGDYMEEDPMCNYVNEISATS